MSTCISEKQINGSPSHTMALGDDRQECTLSPPTQDWGSCVLFYF